MNSSIQQVHQEAVLVVTDSGQAVDGVLNLLQGTHYQIQVVTMPSHGSNAADSQGAALIAQLPDVALVDGVLLDVMVPTCYLLCRQLRELDAAIPIIFFSTGPLQPDRLRVYEAGGSDYLLSPLVQPEVVSRLSIHIHARRLQDKFNRVFVSSPAPTFISTLDEGRVLDVNPAFVAMFGYSREELIGNRGIDLNLWANPRDRDRVVQTLRAAKPIHDQEFQGRTRSGAILTVLLSSDIIDYDGQPCLMGILQDITSRKYAEEQRQHRVEMYSLLSTISRQLLDQDPDSAIQFTLQAIGEFTHSDRINIIQADAHSDTMSMTHEWCRLGIAASLPMFQGLHPDRCPWVMQQLGNGNPVEIGRLDELPPEAAPERAMMEQAGVCSTVIVPMVNRGEVAGYLGADAVEAERTWSREDIGLFQLAGELVAIAQARYAAEETQRLYLHAVSHDLRNPVVGMSMVVKNLLARHPADDPRVEVPTRVLARMDSSCDRQLQLINSLVETSEVEIRGVSLRCQALPLLGLLQELIETWQPILTDYQATLTHDMPLTLPAVYADPAQLWRVFENLIANALKYNAPGITLTLSAHEVPQPKATAPRFIRCAVADNGIGLTSAHAASIFDRYHRGTSATRGLGLGLYICRQIITAHGGEIGVKPSDGSGAEFWFTLPIAKQP